MELAVIGSGYVGLVAGACFADTGNRVTVVDRDVDRIAMLNRGDCPIYEPGLPDLLANGQASGRLRFTSSLRELTATPSVVFFAVGTPALASGDPDLTDLWHAVDELVDTLRGPAIAVLKSTVPVGTQALVQARIDETCPFAVPVVSNPEFLKEGSAVDDFQSPERVIVGTHDREALAVLRRLYRPFMHRSDRLIPMDPLSSELTKYACNAMLATRVSFMNELARLCEPLGADISHIRKGMGTDPRIGPYFLYASLGYGGSCFHKDLQALLRIGERLDRPLSVISATHQANLDQHTHFVERTTHALGRVAGATVAIWGTAFKANTNDVRNSPALALIRALRDRGAQLQVHDPQALEPARAELGDTQITWCTDPYEAVHGTDGLVICTEWSVYRTPDFDRMAKQMRRPLLIDGRNLYDLEWMLETPFRYISVGRPSVEGQSPAGRGSQEAT